MKSKMIAMFLAAMFGSTLIWGLHDPQPVVAQSQPAPVTKESSATFRRVVQSTLPAVVSITTKMKPMEASHELRDPEDLYGPNMPDELRRFFEEFERRRSNPRGGFGSGVIMDESGIVLTNNHVVMGAESVTVRLQDGRTFTAKDIKRDRKTDLAIIKLDADDAKNLPVAEFGDSDGLEIGDWVLAMGAPFGLSGSVTAGIISAKSRGLGMNMYEDFIQTDAAINPGNSGGPIVNLDGRVIGINAAIRTNTGSFEGIGFAIPSNMAKEIMTKLAKYGRVRRGYLGIQMDPSNKALLDRLGLSHGIQIAMLTDGDTPARKAKLQPADIILDIDGTDATDIDSLKAQVSGIPPGTTVNFKIYRDGETITVPVTIEEQPEEFGLTQRLPFRRRRPTPDEPETVSVDKIGAEVRQLTPDVANQLGIEERSGVVVIEVKEDSVAEKAGLMKGSIILEAERQAVRSARQFARIVSNTDLKKVGLLLKVKQPDKATRLLVVQEQP